MRKINFCIKARYVKIFNKARGGVLLRKLLVIAVICANLVSGCSLTVTTSKSIENKNDHVSDLLEERKNKYDVKTDSAATEQNKKTIFKIPEPYYELALEDDYEQFQNLEQLFNEFQELNSFYPVGGGLGYTLAYSYFRPSDKKMTFFGYLTNGTTYTITDTSFKLNIKFKNHPEVPEKATKITFANSLVGDIEPYVTIPVVFSFEIAELQTEQTFFASNEFSDATMSDISVLTKE